MQFVKKSHIVSTSDNVAFLICVVLRYMLSSHHIHIDISLYSA